jgi:hypothetical protein
MFDFPVSPTVGTTYTSAGVTYTYTGSVWDITGSTGAFEIGDVKSGFQTTDHNGWIKLDGRAVSTLTATQQANAATLGFAANLPNAALCSLRQDDNAAPGVVGGSPKIGVNNLPAHNMTAASAGAHTHTTDSQGAHQHVSRYSSHEMTINTASNIWSIDEGVEETLGAHTHTAASAGAHTHTVALGGGAVDYWIKAVVVNFFVQLGA